jgi:hypothetical protein
MRKKQALIGRGCLTLIVWCVGGSVIVVSCLR